MFAGVFDVVDRVTGHLDDLSGRWWFLGVIFLVAYLDSIIPVVPSETAVILGGVAAGLGKQEIYLVIAAGALGALLGDLSAYQVGARLRGLVERRAARRPGFRARLDWAKRAIHTRGGTLLITARFIPGGRTALTISSGVTRQPLGWFTRWIVVAVVLWAGYAGLLGYFFGSRFEDDHTTAFLLAFGTALSVTIVIEVVRHLRKRRTSGTGDASGEPTG
ncbi:MAG TPA: DedA family protein [Ilumatobacter sp.]|nr:DedA family protein [Ilumatobacter sp.]